MKKYIPTEEELSNILKMYNEELFGSQTISQITGLSKQVIIRILKENGVKMGPSGRRFIGGRKVAIQKYESKPETKEKRKNNHKKWSENNREHLNEYHKQWREDNVEKWRENKRTYQRVRKANDPLYKLISNFRTAIYQVLKESNVQKNGHYFQVLKYSAEDLINHLENQFIDDMNWENYGEWHVDHIKPISSFDIKEIGDDEFMKCWSLDNLQPLWGYDNLRKTNKI